MKLALVFRRARLPVMVACLLLPLAAAAGGPVALAPVKADPALAPVARGFDRWLEGAVRSGGRVVVLLPAGGSPPR
jgi:hypothetical protein